MFKQNVSKTRILAQSTASSDISSPHNSSSQIPQNVFEYPSVDGVAAGKILKGFIKLNFDPR